MKTIKKFILFLRFKRWYYLGRIKIKRKIKKAARKGNIKVILGCADSLWEGWVSTDLPHFDISKASDWDFFFRNKKIDNLFAEHVLEHLTKDEVKTVIQFAYHYLADKGYFRIAVPDAWHPNPEYIARESDTSGYYKPPHNHKSFWNLKTLSELIISEGFSVEPLEYCNEKREIITSDFSLTNGFFKRSKSKGFICDIKDYSSLIMDAKK